MPNLLDNGATFKQLLVQFAEAARLSSFDASGRASLPSRASDLERCTRAINRGYKLFLRSWDWSFLEIEHRITFAPDGRGPLNIAGDASRYALPPFVRAMPMSVLRFVDDWSVRQYICPATRTHVQGRHQMLETTGTPEVFACSELTAPHPSGAGRWELYVFPRPDQAYTVEGTWRAGQYDMAELHEKHIAGADHDHAILAAALYLWKMDDSDDDAEKNRYERAWEQALAQSQKLDGRNRPISLGTLAPTRTPGVDDVRPRRWIPPVTYTKP